MPGLARRRRRPQPSLGCSLPCTETSTRPIPGEPPPLPAQVGLHPPPMRSCRVTCRTKIEKRIQLVAPPLTLSETERDSPFCCPRMGVGGGGASWVTSLGPRWRAGPDLASLMYRCTARTHATPAKCRLRVQTGPDQPRQSRIAGDPMRLVARRISVFGTAELPAGVSDGALVTLQWHTDENRR